MTDIVFEPGCLTVVTGPRGTKKTELMVEVCKRVIDAGGAVLYLGNRNRHLWEQDGPRFIGVESTESMRDGLREAARSVFNHPEPSMIVFDELNKCSFDDAREFARVADSHNVSIVMVTTPKSSTRGPCPLMTYAQWAYSVDEGITLLKGPYN